MARDPAFDSAFDSAFDPAHDPSRHPAWRALQAREHAAHAAHAAHAPDGAPAPDEGGLLIDCGTCTVRGDACGDCVVTVMLGCAPGPVELDPDERRALEVLGRGGLVPRLRLVAHGDEPAAG